MSKNILILTGSARKNGNSDRLADAFIQGAKEAGHTTFKYSTADKNIKGCIDCKTCFSKGQPCSFEDDFNNLATYLEKADVLVFATPLYWFSFPAKLKAAIDKFNSYLIANKTLPIKESALLVCGGDTDENSYKGIITSYKSIAGFLKWTDRGILIGKGLANKDDILKTDTLQKAELLGKNI